MFDSFHAFLSQTVQLSQADKLLCEANFEFLQLGKNSLLEAADKVPKHLYFINKGAVRNFYVDDQGDEVTTAIASSGQFITSFLDFINDRKSDLNLECITDCELLRIERPKLAAIIDNSEPFKQFSLAIFQQAMQANQERANDLATLSAEQRYHKLVEQAPEIIQQVPLQYISSYLGIKPQSLSRIRKQWNS
jgi:CRP/FNR family transcriptional regulator, anaerobic regulatory protein